VNSRSETPARPAPEAPDAFGGAGGPNPATAMRRVGRGSTLNLVGAATSAVGGFALTFVIARGMSLDLAGVFFSTTSLFLILTGIGQLGTSTGLVYFISRARSLNVPHLVRVYLRTATSVVLSAAVLMAVVLLVLSHQVAEVISPGHVGVAEGNLRVLAVFIPFAGLANVAISASRGMATMRISAFADQIGRTIAQLGLVALALAISRSGWSALAWGLPYIPLALVAWLLLSRIRPADNGIHEEAGPRVSEFWKFSIPRALASVAQVAIQRLDVVLVAAMAGVGQAAIYAAASRFITLGQLGGGAISQAVQPQLGGAMARQDHTLSRHLYQCSTAWLIAITWPIYLVLIGSGGLLLQIFGHKYGGGSTVLVILCSSMLVATGCGMVDIVLLMGGRSTWNLYNVLLAFVVNIGLDLLLIPSHGILGAAIGWAAAIVLANVVPLSQVAFALHLHPFGRGARAAMLLSLVCFGLVPGIARLASGSDVVTLAGVGVGAVLYVAGLWRLRSTLLLGELLGLRRAQRAGRAGPPGTAAEGGPPSPGAPEGGAREPAGPDADLPAGASAEAVAARGRHVERRVTPSSEAISEDRRRGSE
jgi:O-antigen/teichoic acid export membrane protein